MAVASGIKTTTTTSSPSPSAQANASSVIAQPVTSSSPPVEAISVAAPRKLPSRCGNITVPSTGILTPTTVCDTPSPPHSGTNGGSGTEPTAEELVQALIQMLSSPNQYMDNASTAGVTGRNVF